MAPKSFQFLFLVELISRLYWLFLNPYTVSLLQTSCIFIPPSKFSRSVKYHPKMPKNKYFCKSDPLPPPSEIMESPPTHFPNYRQSEKANEFFCTSVNLHPFKTLNMIQMEVGLKHLHTSALFSINVMQETSGHDAGCILSSYIFSQCFLNYLACTIYRPNATSLNMHDVSIKTLMSSRPFQWQPSRDGKQNVFGGKQTVRSRWLMQEPPTSRLKAKRQNTLGDVNDALSNNIYITL